MKDATNIKLIKKRHKTNVAKRPNLTTREPQEIRSYFF
jgi:hypothetical protein